MDRRKKNSVQQEKSLTLRERWQQFKQNHGLSFAQLYQQIIAFRHKKISLLDAMINVLKKIKKIRWKKLPVIKFVRRIWLTFSKSWRTIMIAFGLFFAFYYLIGAYLAENIDVSTEYKINTEDAPLFETPDCMAFLLKREIDDNMWTPNLPVIFPASVLDNMPNFQMGIVAAVRDVAKVIRGFSQNTPAQQEDIKKAVKLLNYSPKIWLISHSGKFNLAPSSNAQYRKAVQLLRKYRQEGVFLPQNKEVYALLQQMSKTLFKLSDKNAEQQREHARDWVDCYGDDIFYYNRGYALALWQISRVLGKDYKDVLIRRNTYEDWTYLVSSLKKAAEYAPSVVRNSEPDSLFAANHLLIQNYYLVRAALAAERVGNNLLKEQ